MSELNTVDHQDWPTQTRHDDALTVIMPSAASRVGLARRALRSLEAANVAWPIIIGDFSGPTERLALRALAKQFRSLDITLVEQLPHQHMLERIADCADQARTPYALVHADDDFLVASAAERCVDVLLGNPGLAAAKGQISFCSINDKGALVANINEGHSCDADKAYTRVLRQVAAFSPTVSCSAPYRSIGRCLAKGARHGGQRSLLAVSRVSLDGGRRGDGSHRRPVLHTRRQPIRYTRTSSTARICLIGPTWWSRATSPRSLRSSTASSQISLSTANVDPHEVESSVREVSMWLVRRGLGGPAPQPKSRRTASQANTGAPPPLIHPAYRTSRLNVTRGELLGVGPSFTLVNICFN